ncbi:MAG TPA: type IV pilus modification protein PilV [Aquabacterium sp.]|nr:type IV pilus modification protein PilV [Aquabacterium sp.]
MIEKRHQPQAGVTLIEVLVSILILGVAMISLAGLQSYTVKYQMGSSSRAVLSMLVGDYAERVRANLQAAPGGSAVSGTSPYLFSADWADQSDPPSAASVDCAHAVCTDAMTLATWDMSLWRQRVREELPRGSVRVTGDIRDGLNLTIMWQDNDFSDKSPICSASLSPVDARHCCPADLPAGVRCANFQVVP